MRSMMFARTFPMTHPRKGEPTHFVEKIWKSLCANGECPEELDKFIQHYEAQVRGEYAKYNEIHRKGHTIRAGTRWEVGDYFIPRVWSDKPYRSKTIQFAPPIRVEKIYDISRIGFNFRMDYRIIPVATLEQICKNDGLEYVDFYDWFKDAGVKKDWFGQIICWDKKIEY